MARWAHATPAAGWATIQRRTVATTSGRESRVVAPRRLGSMASAMPAVVPADSTAAATASRFAAASGTSALALVSARMIAESRSGCRCSSAMVT